MSVIVRCCKAASLMFGSFSVGVCIGVWAGFEWGKFFSKDVR